MNKTLLAPSLLSYDFSNLGEAINKIENNFGSWVHIDVMDGIFVPEITFGQPIVRSIRPLTSLPFDVHLMTEKPENQIESFAKAGADLITFHYEACKNNIDEVIDLIKSFNKKVGISIKPQTEASEIFPYLNKVDLVLVMTVEPGFGGQEFMHDCALKIPSIKEKAPEKLIIQVDGGINNLTAKICTSLGANSLVAGNYIYKSSNYKKAIDSLK